MHIMNFHVTMDIAYCWKVDVTGSMTVEIIPMNIIALVRKSLMYNPFDLLLVSGLVLGCCVKFPI